MAKKIQQEFDVLIQTVGEKRALSILKKLNKATEESVVAQNKVKRTQEGVYKQSLSTGKEFSRQAQGLGGLVRVYATIAANIFAVSSAFQVLRNNANLQNMIASSNELAQTTGLMATSISRDLQKITKGALGFQQALQATNLALSGGATVTQLRGITEIATKAAQALGRSVPDAVNRLIQAVTKAEPELVDEFGIILRVREANEAYAISLGKTAEQLTTFERQQALVNQLLAQGTEKFQDVQIKENPFDTLAASLTELSQTIVTVISGPFAKLADLISGNIVVSIGLIALAINKIVKLAIPSLTESLERLRERSKIALESANAQLAKISLTAATAGVSAFDSKEAAAKFAQSFAGEIDSAFKPDSKIGKAFRTGLPKAISAALKGDKSFEEGLKKSILEAREGFAEISVGLQGPSKVEVALAKELLAAIQTIKGETIQVEQASNKVAESFRRAVAQGKLLAGQMSVAAKTGYTLGLTSSNLFKSFKNLRVEIAKSNIELGGTQSKLASILTSMSAFVGIAAAGLTRLAGSILAISGNIGLIVAGLTVVGSFILNILKNTSLMSKKVSEAKEKFDGVKDSIEDINKEFGGFRQEFDETDFKNINEMVKGFTKLTNIAQQFTAQLKEGSIALSAMTKAKGLDSLFNSISEFFGGGLEGAIKTQLQALKDLSILLNRDIKLGLNATSTGILNVDGAINKSTDINKLYSGLVRNLADSEDALLQIIKATYEAGDAAVELQTRFSSALSTINTELNRGSNLLASYLQPTIKKTAYDDILTSITEISNSIDTLYSTSTESGKDATAAIVEFAKTIGTENKAIFRITRETEQGFVEDVKRSEELFKTIVSTIRTFQISIDNAKRSIVQLNNEVEAGLLSSYDELAQKQKELIELQLTQNNYLIEQNNSLLKTVDIRTDEGRFLSLQTQELRQANQLLERQRDLYDDVYTSLQKRIAIFTTLENLAERTSEFTKLIYDYTLDVASNRYLEKSLRSPSVSKLFDYKKREEEAKLSERLLESRKELSKIEFDLHNNYKLLYKISEKSLKLHIRDFELDKYKLEKQILIKKAVDEMLKARREQYDLEVQTTELLDRQNFINPQFSSALRKGFMREAEDFIANMKSGIENIVDVVTTGFDTASETLIDNLVEGRNIFSNFGENVKSALRESISSALTEQLQGAIRKAILQRTGSVEDERKALEKQLIEQFKTTTSVIETLIRVIQELSTVITTNVSSSNILSNNMGAVAASLTELITTNKEFIEIEKDMLSFARSRDAGAGATGNIPKAPIVNPYPSPTGPLYPIPYVPPVRVPKSALPPVSENNIKDNTRSVKDMTEIVTVASTATEELSRNTDILKIATIANTAATVANTISNISGGGGGGGVSGFLSAAADLSGVFMAAKGALIHKPTPVIAGEGPTSEAIVPLPDNRAIPVKFDNDSNSTQSVTINQSFDFRGADRQAISELKMQSERIKKETMEAVFKEINKGGTAAKISGRRR